MQLKIEKMQYKHIDSILEIEKLSFPMPWSSNAFIQEIRDNDLAHYYVIVLDDIAVGYAGMWIILDEAHVTNIAIHPKCRGKGLGEKLLVTLFLEAIKLNAKKITLEVRKSNEIAQKMYKKHNFTKAGTRRGYYEDNHEDAIIMWKNLF